MEEKMKNKRSFIIMVLILILTISMFVGCSDSNSENENNDENVEEPSNVDERKKIGMVVKSTNAEYIQAFIIGAEQTSEELGIDISIVDAQGDSMKIMNAIDNFLVQGIDGFILAGAVDLVTLVPGIEKLNEENIPVFALDTCPEGGYVDMFLTFDLIESSEKAANQMIEGLKEANNGEVPEGVVVEITGSLVDMFAKDCHTGFENVISEYPQLTIAQGEGNWNNEDSYNRTSDLFSRFGDEIVAVYVHTPDIMGAGAVSAIENSSRNPEDYFISGICIGSEGLDLLKEGKLYAVVEQPALDSSIMAVTYLNDIFNGKEIPKIGDTVVEEGALWSPAKVIENTYADGGRTMIMQGPLVPQEVSPDNEKLWENRLGLE
jgi:ribose transport system substrate-binding protein